ncbi:MAG: phosphodiester glycosidase family protein [Gammaproteobacteria bacterium]|nr:phosphodiester glycosidase family protein [Gammaproteobacteria bacterium]
MTRQSRIKKIIALWMFAIFSSTVQANWRLLQPGISYQDIAPIYINDWSHIHVFRINPEFYKLSLIQHQGLEHRFPSIENYAAHAKAPLAINGGFFDDNLHPLGLRISDYRQLNGFRNISWWSIFYIQNKKPHIQSARQFQMNKNIEFAVQSGPRLLIDHHIPKLRPGYAERTALCILPNHEIAIVITQYYPVNLKQLARILQAAPLNCEQAMNLDGGSSTQFFAKFPQLFLHMPGLVSVSDAITVIPRS